MSVGGGGRVLVGAAVGEGIADAVGIAITTRSGGLVDFDLPLQAATIDSRPDSSTAVNSHIDLLTMFSRSESEQHDATAHEVS